MTRPSKSWEALEMLAMFKGGSLGNERRRPAPPDSLRNGLAFGYWLDAKSFFRAVLFAKLPRKQVVALALAMRGAFLRNFTEGGV